MIVKPKAQSRNCCTSCAPVVCSCCCLLHEGANTSPQGLVIFALSFAAPRVHGVRYWSDSPTACCYPERGLILCWGLRDYDIDILKNCYGKAAIRNAGKVIMSLIVCLLDGTYGRCIANLLFDQTRQWCICHERRVAHCVLAAQLTDRHTAFGLAQNCKNLGFAISRHLHQNLLRYLAEKILLPHPLSFGGITQSWRRICPCLQAKSRSHDALFRTLHGGDANTAQVQADWWRIKSLGGSSTKLNPSRPKP